MQNFDKKFILNMNVNSQNNWYWCSKNHWASLDVPLYGHAIGVCCAVTPHNLMRTVFFRVTINLYLDVWLILALLLNELTEEKNMVISCLMATWPHSKSPIGCLKRVNGKLMEIHGLWHPGLPDLNLCGILKDKIDMNSSHSANNRRMIFTDRLPIIEHKNSFMC
jgi:hypothetical protein